MPQTGMVRVLQSDYQEVSEQVEIVKTMLSKAGNDHTRQQAENTALAKELDAKRLRLDDMRQKVTSNRHKLEGEYVHLDSLAAKEKELDTLASLEGKRLEEVCSQCPCQCCSGQSHFLSMRLMSVLNKLLLLLLHIVACCGLVVVLAGQGRH